MTRHSSEERAIRSAPSSPYIPNRTLALGHDGVRTSGQNTPSASTTNRTFHPDASVVLVGIRGSGKRSLGLIAAAALGRRFITEDHFFQLTTGFSRQDFLKNHGSELFHQTDVEVTRKMLEENKHHCVIDCGLGSMTSSLQDYLRLYCMTNPVVYIMRDMVQIKSLLNLGDRSVKLLEAGDPSHRKCSNFEYYNLQDDTAEEGSEETADRSSPTYSFKLRHAQEDFSRFVRQITSTVPNYSSTFSIDAPLETRAYTHALEIPLSKLTDELDVSALEVAGDLVDIIVDKWNGHMSKIFSKAVASVRRHIGVPVCVTNRATELGIDLRMAIINHALRTGVEYVSIDLERERHLIPSVLAMKGPSKIIGTVQRKTTSGQDWRESKIIELAQAAVSARCDSVRIVMPAASRNDLSSVLWLREELQHRLKPSVPITIFASGSLGRASQMLNTHMTSVTHPILQAGNDPFAPVLTSPQLLRALGSSFVLDTLQFCIVGANVSQSLSPVMHNAAYEATGLSHSYTLKNIISWDEVEALATNDHFGGASVIQPWKVKAMDKVSSLSHHARAIGAVNTLIPLRKDANGKMPPLASQAYNRNQAGPIAAWHGDNTDFIGIKVCLSRSLSPRNVIQPKTTGLVVGAGGMARAAVYAMLQLGCRNVFIYNRTLANARAVASHFMTQSTRDARTSTAGLNVLVLESLEEPWPSGFAMPTMVVSCVTHEQIDGNAEAVFKMPKQWLESSSGGVVVEMAYNHVTALVQQIMQFRVETGIPWVVVPGVETLIEQAVAQFEIMVGRRGPRFVMTKAVKSVMNDKRYMTDFGSWRSSG
jgi:shikimate 5-dehydrogenase/shikimate kinase/3-dehydroquinate dehydratase